MVIEQSIPKEAFAMIVEMMQLDVQKPNKSSKIQEIEEIEE